MAKSVAQYCEIAGMSFVADKPCFFAHDGSTCSLIRVHGTPTILAEDELKEKLIDFADLIGPQLGKRGHGLTISYERSGNIAEDLDRLFDPLAQASERKGLKMEAGLRETRAVLEGEAIAERVLIAVWTYREAAVPEQFREEAAQRRSKMGYLPVSDFIQDGEGPYEVIEATHFAAVNSVLQGLKTIGIMAKLLGEGTKEGTREDLAEVRRGILFHETPMAWQPPSAPSFPMVKKKQSSDVSSLFAPSINSVLMTSAARASNDLRTISIGGRSYAIAQMTMFPREMDQFGNLIKSIGTGMDRNAKMPFRVAMHFEGGAKVNGFKQAIATILSALGTANKNIYRNLEAIGKKFAQDQDTFVNARLIATTWIEPGELESTLNDRRSTLMRAMTSWRGPTMADSATDPMRLLSETAPGMTAVCRSAPAAIAPIRELSLAFPFGRDAAIEDQGETIFMTMDSKPAPFRAHSPLQTSWLNLIWAPPGSGKSVLMNAMNVDFAAYHNSAKLPFIGVIDVGISSDGFIKTLRAALPPERAKEVKYIKLQNEANARDYFINPFDIGLGRRKPLSREAAFVSNFLAEILGAVSDPKVSALIDALIANLYRNFSDLEVTNNCRLWQPDKDSELDDEVRSLGIALHDHKPWWEIVDELMLAGRPDIAARAQRYAMPTLNDVITLLVEKTLRDRFGDLCETCKVQVESAVNRYPLFSNETRLDIGEARIVAIDLEAVVQKSPNSDADRQRNTLMFLTARDLFVRKVSGSSDEIDAMDLPHDPKLRDLYKKYWAQVFSEVTTIRKRFCIDEFHITGASLPMVNQINQDVRHGRKWGFEMILASQLVEDFSNLIDMASNVFILKSDTEQSLTEMERILNISSATKDAVRKHVNGPSANGSTILVGRRTKHGDSWLLLKNKIGPVRLWALTTTFEDMRIRDALYSHTGSVDLALEILAQRFPTGTAVTHWNEVTSRSSAGEDVPVKIATELLLQHNAQQHRAA